jgi:CDP-diacylglycerol--glycerol-3-phosphate 3-phosphatidyltransferase
MSQAPVTAERPWAYLSWPNRLSLLRLLLVAPFVVLMQHQQSQDLFRHLAMGIFVFMALSDAADGVLARRTQSASRLGMFLDPLADKALITCAAILLSLDHSHVPGARLPDWVVVLIVGKDLWVIVGFLVVFILTGRARVAPTRVGKISTCGQLMMVTAVLISPDLNRLCPQVGSWVARVLWWAVAGLCLLAAITYTRLGLTFVAEADRSDQGNRAARSA